MPTSPVWSQSLFRLGVDLASASLGSRSSNLTKAIGCFEAAPQVRTEHEFPHDWSGIQNNLGAAWMNMPPGDQGSNRAGGIACYEAALRVLTCKECQG